MARVHFLNVDPGACTLIEHNSGRDTLIDTCGARKDPATFEAKAADYLSEAKNYGMKCRLTNPIDYLSSLGQQSLHRLVITHPDMDHLDGFADIVDSFGLANLWDLDHCKEKPSFDKGCPYRELDWDVYESKRSSSEDPKVLKLYSDARGQFFNRGDNNESGGDGLYVLSPTKDLVKQGNEACDWNDCSYALLYLSHGVKVLLAGDTHNASWKHILEEHKNDIGDIDILLAPHHGRDSGRNFDFLKTLRPKLTIIGNAPSEHIAYAQYRKYSRRIVTSNQAGNIVVEIGSTGANVLVENPSYAKDVCGYTPVPRSGMYPVPLL